MHIKLLLTIFPVIIPNSRLCPAFFPVFPNSRLFSGFPVFPGSGVTLSIAAGILEEFRAKNTEGIPDKVPKETRQDSWKDPRGMNVVPENYRRNPWDEILEEITKVIPAGISEIIIEKTLEKSKKRDKGSEQEPYRENLKESHKNSLNKSLNTYQEEFLIKSKQESLQEFFTGGFVTVEKPFQNFTALEPDTLRLIGHHCFT